jgi:HAD superfamily hydrolase (TIGR01509 family)
MRHVVGAVVFDLDGVLVDSEPVWERVRRRYVADHGGRWRPDTQSRLMGMSTGEWARYLSDELGVGRTAEQVAADVVTEMVASYAASIPLVPGADTVVRELAQSWPLGLASSSPPRLIEAALTGSRLADTFAVALSSESVPRGKPAPDIYLAVAERMGQDPAGCVAVEDSSNGVRSAAQAGMYVIAVPSRRYPLDEDARRRAGLVVDSLDAITPEAVRAATSTQHGLDVHETAEAVDGGDDADGE